MSPDLSTAVAPKKIEEQPTGDADLNKASMFSSLQGVALLPAVFLFVFILLITFQAAVAYNRSSQMDNLIESLQKTQITLENQIVNLNTQMELMKHGQGQNS